MKNLKISIITPSYNQGEFISDCIESVLAQNYVNYEHIVVDANSTDSTHEVLKNYPHLIKIIEDDDGPSSAINKGFSTATGDIIAWLNSDDYYDKNVFERINREFKNDKDIKMLYGNLTFVDEFKNVIRVDKSKKFDFYSLVNISPDIRQPCTFFKKEILESVGYLDTGLKIVFDYDLFIKLAKITDPLYVDENFSFYRDHSDTITRMNIRKQAVEIYKTSRKYGGKIISPISKLVIYRLIKGKL